MKNTLPLFAILSFTILLSHAQKIQLKDGTITVDKVPVAKLEGEATLTKGTHINLKSPADELLISIDEKIVKYKSHFQEDLHFTRVTFVPLNQTVYRTDIHRYTSEKKIIGYLYDKIGKDFLTKDGLNKDLVQAYINTNDEASKIHEDSTKVGSIVAKYLEGLKQPAQQRNIKSRVEFKFLSDNKFNWTGFEGVREYADRTFLQIYQDNVLIGGIVKILVKDAVNATDYSACRYFLLRKITPVEVHGEKYEYAPLALLKTYNPGRMGSLPTDITIENEGMRQAPTIKDFQNAEGILVETLIQEGLL